LETGKAGGGQKSVIGSRKEINLRVGKRRAAKKWSGSGVYV